MFKKENLKIWGSIAGAIILLLLVFSGFFTRIGEGVPVWDALLAPFRNVNVQNNDYTIADGTIPGIAQPEQPMQPIEPTPPANDLAPEMTTEIGGTFIDSVGIVWRVLYEDESGNRLIITEYVHEVGTFYNWDDYWVPLHESELRWDLLEWFYSTLAPELYLRALPVGNIENDVRSEPVHGLNLANWSRENAPEGWTYAGTGTATGENALFVLSVSEVNRYFEGGNDWQWGNFDRRAIDVRAMNRDPIDQLHAGADWYLRSPGSFSQGSGFQRGYSRVAVVTGMGNIDSNHTDGRLRNVIGDQRPNTGFRPALWISPEK